METMQAPAVVQLESEPPAILYVDPPLPGPTLFRTVVIPYRTEHLRIVPVYGAAAHECFTAHWSPSPDH